MKQASIVSVSFKPFGDCQCSSYRALQKYWKNTYGYRLANEAENTMIYVGVRFWASAERCYTYPILCVRAQQPILVPRVNPYPIMNSFLRLLQAKLSGSCGGGFNMPLRKPSFPSAAVRWTAADAQQVFCN